LPRASEVPSSGFGYPLDGVRLVSPRKPLSASNAHGLSPFRAFLLPRDWSALSNTPSAPALSSETLRLRTGASAGCPPKEAVPSAARRIRSGRGLGSPGRLKGPSGSPSETIHVKSISLPTCPPRSYGKATFQPPHRRASGDSDSSGPAFPSEKGAGPYGLSNRLLTLPLRRPAPRGLFFPLEVPTVSQQPRSLS
jgi:hypothetical protein